MTQPAEKTTEGNAMPNSFKSDVMRILHERGFLHQCSDWQGLDKIFLENPTTPTYWGSDPSGQSLHVGHLKSMMQMYWLQQCGGKPIMLVGGATGRIGDPTDKDKDRPMMTEDIIAKNLAGLKKSYSTLLRFGDASSDAIMVDNYDWFKGIGYIDFLRDVGRYVSVNRMLAMESVKRRLERETHLSFLEFNYSLLQGYDFVHLYREYGCRAQLCGADQWGNAIAGIDMGHKLAQTDLYVMSTALLTDASGKKMGKSEGNAIWLNDDMLPAYDFYQFWRNTDDADVERFLAFFTTLPMDEVRRLGALRGADINEAKKILAFEVTKLIRGETAASEAANTAKATFAEGIKADGLPTIEVNQADLSAHPISDHFIALGFLTSKGEARRMIKQNGLRLNDTPITEDHPLTPADFDTDGVAKLSKGKKQHGLVKVV